MINKVFLRESLLVMLILLLVNCEIEHPCSSLYLAAYYNDSKGENLIYF
jgi:hypothetical protein